MADRDTAPRESHQPGFHFSDFTPADDAAPPSAPEARFSADTHVGVDVLEDIGFDFEPDEESGAQAAHEDILASAAPIDDDDLGSAPTQSARVPSEILDADVDDTTLGLTPEVVEQARAAAPDARLGDESGAADMSDESGTQILPQQEVPADEGGAEERGPVADLAAAIPQTPIDVGADASAAQDGKAADSWHDDETVVREGRPTEGDAATVILEPGSRVEPESNAASGEAEVEVSRLFEGRPVETAELSLHTVMAAAAAEEDDEVELELPPDLGFGVGDVLPDAPGAEEARSGTVGRYLDEEDSFEDILAGVGEAYRDDEELVLSPEAAGLPLDEDVMAGQAAADAGGGSAAADDASAILGPEDGGWGTPDALLPSEAPPGAGPSLPDLPEDRGLDSVLEPPASGVAEEDDVPSDGDWLGSGALPASPEGEAPEQAGAVLAAEDLVNVLGEGAASGMPADADAALVDGDFAGRGGLPDAPAGEADGVGEEMVGGSDLEDMLGAPSAGGSAPAADEANNEAGAGVPAADTEAPPLPEDAAAMPADVSSLVPDGDVDLAGSMDAAIDDEGDEWDEGTLDEVPDSPQEAAAGVALPPEEVMPAEAPSGAGSDAEELFRDADAGPPSSEFEDVFDSQVDQGGADFLGLPGEGGLDSLIDDIAAQDHAAGTGGGGDAGSGVGPEPKARRGNWLKLGVALGMAGAGYLNQALDFKRNWGLYCDLAAAVIGVISAAVIIASLIWY